MAMTRRQFFRAAAIRLTALAAGFAMGRAAAPAALEKLHAWTLPAEPRITWRARPLITYNGVPLREGIDYHFDDRGTLHLPDGGVSVVGGWAVADEGFDGYIMAFDLPPL